MGQYGRNSGPPAIVVFMVAVGFIFGGYYLWVGLQNYIQTGGLGIIETTEQAQIVSSATAERFIQSVRPTATLRPTSTPIPECKDFVVSVPSAIVRTAPDSNSAIFDSFNRGTVVCVIDRVPDTEWYLVDNAPSSRRLESVYMHQSVIRAVNPTPTPSRTPTPLPTVTDVPTLTPSLTPTTRPTDTPDPDATETPTPTPTDTLTPTITPTTSFESA